MTKGAFSRKNIFLFFLLAFVFVSALSVLPAQKNAVWTPPGWIDPLGPPPEVSAQTTHNVGGWAWSSNIGWVSFSCENTGTCASVDYGVDYDNGSGNWTGYAWSSNVGWIKFGGLSGFPVGGTDAVLSGDNLTGFARACSVLSDAANCSGSVIPNSGGWDGWIKLSSAAEEPTYGISRVAGNQNQLEGFAWGSDVVGWLKFGTGLYGDGSGCTGVCIIEPPINTYTLSVITAENGTVTSNVGNISCPTICQEVYNENTSVELTAIPNIIGGNVTWSVNPGSLGDCNTPSDTCKKVIMDSDKTVTVTFSSGDNSCPDSDNFLRCTGPTGAECNIGVPIQINTTGLPSSNTTTPPVYFSINSAGASGISDWSITGYRFSTSSVPNGPPDIIGTHVFGNTLAGEGQRTYPEDMYPDLTPESNVRYFMTIPYERRGELDSRVGKIEFHSVIRLNNGTQCNLAPTPYKIHFRYRAGTVN